MRKKVFFIPEINLVNYLFFYLLSFFVSIKVYNLSSFAKKFNRKWIHFLKTRESMDWEEFPILREKTAEIWEGVSVNFESWGRDKLFGTEIEIFKAVCEEFKLKLESLIVMEHIANFSENVVLIDDFSMFYLKKILKRKKGNFSWLSTFNILMSVFNYFIENIIFTSYTFISFIDGIVKNKKLRLKIKYIYDGVSPLELSISEENYTFSWLVDGDKIKKDEIFFLLPWPDFQVIDTAFYPEKDRTFLTDYPRYVNRYATYENILLAAKETIKQLVFSILNPSIKNIIKYKIKVQILRWAPFVHSFKPKIYIANSGTIGNENPLVLYLNSLGILTITWFYGVSFISFLNKRKSNFKTAFYCHKLASRYIFWNNYLRKFFEEHSQYNNVEFKVLGPLMSSDESVMQMNKISLGRKIGLNFKHNFKYIAMFDAPPPSEIFIQNNPQFFDLTTVNKDYNELFIKDILKLLDDYKELFLIYKPKRSLTSGKFYYSEELKEIFEEMKNNPRVKILDYRVNPWLAIALVDMCIVMPFGSPAFAALHYGRSALFHDPMNIASNHRYETISELITHSYPELKKKVKLWLFDNKEITSLKGIEEFIGCSPKENSSEKFREYLCTLSKD